MQFLRLAANWIPLSVYERLVPRDVIGFCWHMVTDACPAHTAHLGTHKTPAQFEADLRWLKSRYEVIDYAQLCEQRAESGERRAGLRARRPAAILTFDDGLREHLTVVAPLLHQHGMPAIFFVTTGFLDNQRLFYRHKVSLCLEAARTRTLAELAELLRQLDSAPASHPTDAPMHRQTDPPPRDAFRAHLLALTSHDESAIDAACRLLGVDTQRFLAERRPYLTSAEVRQLHAAGFTIGAHSVTHTRLGTKEQSVKSTGHAPAVDDQHSALESFDSRATDNWRRTTDNHSPLTEEITNSCRVIRDLTGLSSVPFAFPFSGDGVARARVQEIRRAEPIVGLIFDRRGFRPDAHFVVHRIIADAKPRRVGGQSNLSQLVRNAYRQHRPSTKATQGDR